MNTYKNSIFKILWIFIVFSFTLYAQVPQLLNYQGKLTDPNGKPLNGAYTITFRIYPDTTTQNDKWLEEHKNVQVMHGIFNVLLGSSTPFGDLFTQAGDRYLGITLAGDVELKPRFRLTSVAYAMHSRSATALSAPDGDPVNAVVVDNNGNVGIGTTNMPVPYKLSIATLAMNEGIWLMGNNLKGFGLKTNLGPGSYNSITQAGDHILLWCGSTMDKPDAGLVIAPWRSNASGIRIDPYGNVGIGTANPVCALHVKGYITMEGSDFIMHAPSRGNGGRALVHNGNGSGNDDHLIINYGNDFEAGVYINGLHTVVQGQLVNPSDLRLKTNIRTIPNCLEKINKLRGVSYNWNQFYQSQNGKTDQLNLGLIAQEVETVFPELVVTYGAENYKAVDYGKMTAVLVEAVKELKAENDQLKQELAELKNLIQK